MKDGTESGVTERGLNGILTGKLQVIIAENHTFQVGAVDAKATRQLVTRCSAKKVLCFEYRVAMVNFS
jgi:hypothetical protein